MKKEEKKYTCYMCDEEYPKTSFYASYNPIMKSGLIPYCKKCLKDSCYDLNNNFVIERFKTTLRIIDKPFLEDVWETTNETVKSGKAKEFFGNYIKNIQMQQFRNLGWEETLSESNKKNIAIIHKKIKNPRVDNFKLTDEIVDRWGEGYNDIEYKSFEKKYKFLTNNYREKTSMHTENLLNYIRYRVKEELSTVAGSITEAKQWGALAKDAAKDAKLNVSQLSASDLTDGLDTFSQISRAVEEHYDVTEIFPTYKARPQDAPDFVLWRLIDYVRDLKGLPPSKYEDIYAFYDDFVKEHQERDKIGDIDGNN